MDGAAAPGSTWPQLCAELPSLTRSAETAVVISAYGPLTRAPLRSSMAAGNRNREGGGSASRTGPCGRASTVLATPRWASRHHTQVGTQAGAGSGHCWGKRHKHLPSNLP